jgi:hypothetical protein
MNQRKHEVRLLVSDDELARLDEQRGVVSRAAFSRTLLREPPSRERIATREEVLVLLSEQGRAGKVSALVALLRALGDGDEPDTFDEELERLLRDD